MKKIITKTKQETINFAINYAKTLKGGSVIGLIGELGAGKTIFTKGLALGFNIKRTITSPTFVIMKIYQISNFTRQASTGQFPISNFVHIDAYRLDNEQDIIGIGALEYFNRKDTVTVIEWADKIKKILPKKTKIVKIKYTKNNREINY